MVNQVLQCVLPYQCPCGEAQMILCDNCAAQFMLDPIVATDLPALQFASFAKPLAEAEFKQPFAVYSLASYEGAVAKVIKAYKNGGHFYLEKFFAQLMKELIDYTHDCSKQHYLVPIPSSFKAVMRRGEKHVDLIVKRLEKLKVGEYAPYLVLKGQSQKSKNSVERINSERRLLLKKYLTPPQGNAGIILIDDVLTTGATLAKAYLELGRHGFETCAGFTLAAAPKHK